MFENPGPNIYYVYFFELGYLFFYRTVPGLSNLINQLDDTTFFLLRIFERHSKVKKSVSGRIFILNRTTITKYEIEWSRDPIASTFRSASRILIYLENRKENIRKVSKQFCLSENFEEDVHSSMHKTIVVKYNALLYFTGDLTRFKQWISNNLRDRRNRSTCHCSLEHYFSMTNYVRGSY